MNGILAVGLVARAGSTGSLAGDSCALFLLIAGAVSLGIAAYLLYKAPRMPAMRLDRRHYF